MFVQIEPGGVLYNDLSGAPNLATFVGPDARGAISKAQGYWAEDEMTMGRVTVKVGGRFDRMVGISQDVPQFDGEFNEIGTLTGLGEMVKWNTFSPRVGGNVRLTGDGKTVLRAVAGRYYLPLFLGEFEDLHPGRAVRDLYRYNPATAGYTTFVSRTDPRTQFRIDPDMKAPYTDQFSLGVDRELAKNLGVGVNFIRKNGGNQLGWVDTGGVYGTSTVVINGQSITLFPLLNAPSARSFLRTNGPGYYNNYTAVILTATRRLANRWQFNAGYTRQKSEGLEPGNAGAAPGANRNGTPEGRDPNDLINLEGRLGARDRPNMVSLMGVVRDSEDRSPAVGEPDRRVGNGDLLTGERGAAAGNADDQPRGAGIEVPHASGKVHARPVHQDDVQEWPAPRRADRRGEERAERNGHAVDQEPDLEQRQLPGDEHVPRAAAAPVLREGVLLESSRSSGSGGCG